MATFLCCSRNPSARGNRRRPTAFRLARLLRAYTRYNIPSLLRPVSSRAFAPAIAFAADRLRLGVRQLPRAAAVRDGGQRLVARSRRPHVRPKGRPFGIGRTRPPHSTPLVCEYAEYRGR